MHQAEDGKVHLAYYSPSANVSFVWNGTLNYIDVCPGGYGEPVQAHLLIPGNMLSMTVQEAFNYMKTACEDFLLEVQPRA